MSRQLQFGDWSFDPDTDVLCNGRSTIHLEPQVGKLLEYLLRHQDQLLTRERLLHDVWDGRIVSDDAIHRCIGLLRQALSPGDKRAFIRTIPRKGYIACFPAVAGAGTEVVAEPARRPSGRHRGILAAGIAFLSLLVVPLVLNLGGLRDRVLPAISNRNAPGNLAAEVPSIAVLPFSDLSPGQDQGYFADGVSEEILNLLSRTPELRVIARTSSFSFKDRNTDIATIAEALNVSHVLEGSVRKAGNRVRIAARLVDAASSAQLWSESYDRELGDILAVQADIAAAVAGALEVSLGLGTAGRLPGRSIDSEAFDLYLRGLQQLRSFTHVSLVGAEESFRKSLAHEPRFVPAYYGLGAVLYRQVMHLVVPPRDNLPRLRDVIARGLELMPDNAGLIALNGVVAWYDGNEELAERRVARAMSLDPSDTWIQLQHAIFESDQGHPQEALRVVERSLEIDPLNPILHMAIGFSNLDLWNVDEAIAAAERFRQLSDPNNVTAYHMNGKMKALLRGDYAGAIRDMMGAANTVPPPEGTWSAADVAVFYYTIEDMTNGDRWLERARKTASASDAMFIRMAEEYGTMVRGDAGPFRALRTDRLVNDFDFKRLEHYDLYLLVDELIARNEASRAVELMLDLAPEWSIYKDRPQLAVEEFYPASALVKSAYSSYPAVHFVPLIRALRASGDQIGADNMLGHLERILQSRRDRGLFIEEVHVAEARVLRGDLEGALAALEQAERDRTVYLCWQLRLLHNGTFEAIRHHPRFSALIERIRAEMHRQRAELEAVRSPVQARAVRAPSDLILD
jgi:TolB-like protein/DNA-binding winged helix-turn-helix (wHTH) protein